LTNKRRKISVLTDDPYLAPYLETIARRKKRAEEVEQRITSGRMSLEEFASGHEYFGLHRCDGEWNFTEWAPNAEAIYLIGSFTDWRENPEFALSRINEHGTWQISLPADELKHGDLYRLRIHWKGGSGDRIPAYARRVVQDDHTKIFNAQVWTPESQYRWTNPGYKHTHAVPLIYETHIGMAQENAGIGTYNEFREKILPRIAGAGYNTIQIMGAMEHPYYGSFGYHVSSFFALSSRFGTPEEFKRLVDEAHGAGLSVIIDIVHSHAVSNEVEGLSRFDGTYYQYFHDGDRGRHIAWDSRLFDYGKSEVMHFLLSNCRYWLDEFRIDGFRFDGITSMLYLHHGLGPAFDSYGKYFDSSVDEDAVSYLSLANKLIHLLRPDAITIAEDVSGMPGLAAPIRDGGCGFDYRLAMGVPDCWFKLVNDIRDEDWNMGYLWHELTNRRADERTIGYVESHDQALVGGKSLIFELIDEPIYGFMRVSDVHPLVDRGMAIHKMSRMITLAAVGDGYMNFMGNEFGHPEWIDFPREGNNWSYHHARRLWNLRDDPGLKYHYLADFDKAIIELIRRKNVIPKTPPRLIAIRETDKIIAFERAGLLFFFNFHPDKSVSDYPFEVLPGEYTLVLDTDEPMFGGHGRLAQDQRHITIPERDKNVLRHCLKLYLPCRCGFVLQKCRS